MSDQWWKVELDGQDDHAKASKARDLNVRYSDAWHAAGEPANANVYTSNVHGQDSGSTRIYFFEPRSGEFAKELLTEYSAKACPAPDLSQLRKL